MLQAAAICFVHFYTKVRRTGCKCIESCISGDDVCICVCWGRGGGGRRDRGGSNFILHSRIRILRKQGIKLFYQFDPKCAPVLKDLKYQGVWEYFFFIFTTGFLVYLFASLDDNKAFPKDWSTLKGKERICSSFSKFSSFLKELTS